LKHHESLVSTIIYYTKVIKTSEVFLRHCQKSRKYLKEKKIMIIYKISSWCTRAWLTFSVALKLGRDINLRLSVSILVTGLYLSNVDNRFPLILMFNTSQIPYNKWTHSLLLSVGLHRQKDVSIFGRGGGVHCNSDSHVTGVFYPLCVFPLHFFYMTQWSLKV